MADKTAQLEACKAAASVRDTDHIAAHTLDTCIEALVLTMIAELSVTTTDRCY